MARIRTVKPEFFTSEDIVGLSPFARLLYIALWCEADREGRLVWKPRTFKIRYFPADDCDIGAMASELIVAGLVIEYGDGYAVIPEFGKHQHINPREAESILPKPEHFPRVPDACGRVTDAQGGKEGKGKEGKEIDASGDATVGWQEIVNAYHVALPNCAKVMALTETRKRRFAAAERNARRVCRERGWDYGPDFWTDYFAECAKDPWMRGDVPNPKNAQWKQSIDVLLDDTRFAKVMDAALGSEA